MTKRWSRNLDKKAFTRETADVILGLVVYKKPFLVGFLFCVLVGSGLILLSTLPVGPVHASTDVTGILIADTTWTQANSPFNLTGNVLVESGVTLTIEENTVVDFNDHYIRVNGTLIVQSGVTLNMKGADTSIQVNGVMTARGTSANPIHINGAAGYYALIAPPYYSRITFSQESVNWNEETGSGSIIENAVLNLTSIQTSSSIKITNNVINSGEIYVSAGSPVISDNSISSLIHIEGGGCSVSNNQIINGFILFSGEYGGTGATITNNVISHAQTVSGSNAGIWFSGESSGHVLIEKNLISDNYYGIQIFSPNIGNMPTSLTIQNNTIANNEVGISVSNSYVPTITGNNLQGNTLNIKLVTDYSGNSNDFDAPNNWWGTTDISAINQSIYDFKNDFDLGKVTFVPFLTEPNSEAAPIPEPTPTPTSPSVTSTPTIAATPTATPVQSPTSTPEQPNTQTGLSDIAIAVIIVLVAIIASLLIIIAILLRKKTITNPVPRQTFTFALIFGKISFCN